VVITLATTGCGFLGGVFGFTVTFRSVTVGYCGTLGFWRANFVQCTSDCFVCGFNLGVIESALNIRTVVTVSSHLATLVTQGKLAISCVFVQFVAGFANSLSPTYNPVRGTKRSIDVLVAPKWVSRQIPLKD
jgi:hypothetical protein